MENLRIPPLIEGWLEELNKPTTPRHVKDNRYLMLEELNRVINISLINYRSKVEVKTNILKYNRKGSQ